jgi:hypothetical protein
MRRLQSLLIAALALPALIVLVAGPALADGLMSMSDPAVGTAGPQSAEGPLTLTCTACEAALVLTSGLHIGGAMSNPGSTHGGSLAFNDATRWLSTANALLESSTVATAGTDTAFILRPLNALDTSDNVLDVQSHAAASLFSVSGAGNAVASGTLWASGARLDSLGPRGPVPMSIYGRSADATGSIGVRIGNQTTLTVAGAKIAAFCADHPSTCASEVASIGYDGAATFGGRVSGAGVQAVAGTEPTCDESARGLIWTVAGDTGVADQVKVCAKDAGDVFAWRTIY